MTNHVRKLVLWGLRILGILCALFLGIFAFDAFDEGFLAILLHLVPSLLLGLGVAASWRWEWVGGSLFIILAVFIGVIAVARGNRAIAFSVSLMNYRGRSTRYPTL